MVFSMATASPPLLKPLVEPPRAVARFLADMGTVAGRTFAGWQETLLDGIDGCALTVDQRRAVLDVHPLDDYYFAAVVALEASKIRQVFTEDEAVELLSQIADQVDAAARRNDRLVSDLVFSLIGRVEVALAADVQ